MLLLVGRFSTIFAVVSQRLTVFDLGEHFPQLRSDYALTEQLCAGREAPTASPARIQTLRLCGPSSLPPPSCLS